MLPGRIILLDLDTDGSKIIDVECPKVKLIEHEGILYIQDSFILSKDCKTFTSLYFKAPTIQKI